MDHATLVDIDVHTGADIVNALDAAHADLKVALYATFQDYYDPRLVLATEWLDQYDPLTRYGKLGEMLRGKFPHHRIPPLLLLKMSDPFVRELRDIFGKAADVTGMRLGGQTFGNRYVEDAYVYRIK